MATKKEKEAAEKAAAEEIARQEAHEVAALEMLLEASAKEPPDNRLIALFGEIDEVKAGQLCFNLFHMAADKRYSAIDDEDLTKGLKEVVDPIELMICSPGGNASEMFAIYDCMRLVRDSCPIETLGVGKIGRNCRVMIHSVIGGVSGGIHNVENEIDEIRWVQDQYIKTLADESDLSRAQLKKMLQRKVNIYLSAEQAVEHGIADTII